MYEYGFLWYIRITNIQCMTFANAGYPVSLLNVLNRFSKQQRLPLWWQTSKSVTYSTDFMASSVRRANFQIQVSAPLMPWIRICKENYFNYSGFFCVTLQQSLAKSMSCWECSQRFTPARWSITQTNSTKPI